jgi:hypothetical protein
VHNCFGEGYYWSEVWLDVYSVVTGSDVGNSYRERLLSPSNQNIPTVIFYTSYSADITRQDKIILLKKNKDGTLYKPYQRQEVYRIGSLIEMRSDNGRLEFWKIDTYKENFKFLNGPNG